MPGRNFKHILLTVIWLAVAIVSLSAGLEYYSLPLHDRAYSDLHDVYKPAGYVGHGLGIVGSLMMIVGVAMYSTRKRVRRFEQTGKLANWLTIHIFLCTLGPFLVLLHTAFRFGGIISIAFWSMVAVVASGVFGRYVYKRIPKTANGQFLSEKALYARQKHLFRSILEYHSVDEETLLAILDESSSSNDSRRRSSGFFGALKGDFSHGKRRRRLSLSAALHGVDRADSKMFVRRTLEYQNLIQQTSLSGVFQRLFGYWHVFHLPLALIMLTIMLFHIGIAFTFGYYWIA